MTAARFMPLMALLAWGHAGGMDSAAFQSALGDSKSWSSSEFTSLFSDAQEKGQTIVSRSFMKMPLEVFGASPASVCMRYAKDEAHSVSIVLLDAGYFFGFQNSNLPRGESFEQAKKRFDEAFKLRRKELDDGLSKLGGGAPAALELGVRSGLKMRTQIVRLRGSVARIMSYEHQLLLVDFFRTEAEARTLHTIPPVSTRTQASSLLPPRNDNATTERRISVVPMIPQGNRGYCGVAILAMVSESLGLQPGAEEYAALCNFSYGVDKNPDIREVFGAVAREAGMHALRSTTFENAKMRTSIDQGLPVVVFRHWAEQRDYIHSVYSARIAKGEKAELPVAGTDDRKSWPDKKAPGHASIVNGYRADKREAIFTESWGEHARNKRMRFEEMEGTSYYAIYFYK
jgi:hypothetical protein